MRDKLLKSHSKASKSHPTNLSLQKIKQIDINISEHVTTSNSSESNILIPLHNIKLNSEHSKAKHKCDSCNRFFNRACDLKRHNLIHVKVGNLCESANGCPDTNLEREEKSCTVISKTIAMFTCEICSRTFKAKYSYNRHKRIHTRERPFECVECSKRFRDSGALTRHVKEVHVKIRKHQCNVCSRWFVNRATLEDHHRMHTGERPYVCHHCGIMFKSKAALYQHNKTHSDILPHVCPYCSKGFRRRQELLAHTPTHTNVKTHICDKCGKEFITRSELKRHIVVHSDEKPFTCPSCGLTFSQKRYLNCHFKTQHRKTGEPQSSAEHVPIDLHTY